MIRDSETDVKSIRDAMAGFDTSSHIEANQEITLERVYFPRHHRGVLDMKRQLVVGNRGMGKSFWSHALTNPEVRQKVASVYAFPLLANTEVALGFNGSDKLSGITPTVDEIKTSRKGGYDPALIWKAVIFRVAWHFGRPQTPPSLMEALSVIKANPLKYAAELTELDNSNGKAGASTLIAFDALDRLGHDWTSIRELTRGLLVTVLGLQSFRSIRAKVFMRADQYSDQELFQFPDSSKLRNDHVDLRWEAHDLYGLLFFELCRTGAAEEPLRQLATRLDATSALPEAGKSDRDHLDKQQSLINAIAGEFMGKGSKRGRVYTWLPLHLSDAKNNCSPRTFLTVWKTAAEHGSASGTQAVDYKGLGEGVRSASSARLTELTEDYPWIKEALEPLRRKFVPIERNQLFELWRDAEVINNIQLQAASNNKLPPIRFDVDATPEALLTAISSIDVMEVRANGKINVPDIFRIEAEILRRGGVAVPRRN